MLVTQTGEHAPPRSEEEPGRKPKAGTRTPASYIPVASAVLGSAVIIGSVVLIYGPNDPARVVVASVGLGILAVGIWFAAHPLIKSTRRFVSLRREVVAFMDLVKVLNRQAGEGAEPEDIESTKAKMHETVERIVVKAGEKSCRSAYPPSHPIRETSEDRRTRPELNPAKSHAQTPGRDAGSALRLR